MKIIDLLNSQYALQEMVKQKMPAKMAYALAKNIRLINQELETYEKARINILAAHWTPNPKTNKYDVPDEDQEKWQELHRELLESEAGYQPYQVSFDLAQSIELTPGDLITVRFLFKDLDLELDPEPISAPDPAAAPDPAPEPEPAAAADQEE